MIIFLKHCLWKNFAAEIDMLTNAINMWPEENKQLHRRFFYMAYHTLVFLDYSLSITPENFTNTLPFTLSEVPEDGIDDVVPDEFYTKQQLKEYALLCRNKCRRVIESLTEKSLDQSWIDSSQYMYEELCSGDARKYSILEILFSNMRHVQHHVGQLNLLLRQHINNAPDYVSQANDDL